MCSEGEGGGRSTIGCSVENKGISCVGGCQVTVQQLSEEAMEAWLDKQKRCDQSVTVCEAFADEVKAGFVLGEPWIIFGGRPSGHTRGLYASCSRWIGISE